MSLQKLANILCFKERTASRRQRCIYIGLVLHFQFNVIYVIRCVHIVMDLFVVRIFILNKVARMYCNCLMCAHCYGFVCSENIYSKQGSRIYCNCSMCAYCYGFFCSEKIYSKQGSESIL